MTTDCPATGVPVTVMKPALVSAARTAARLFGAGRRGAAGWGDQHRAQQATGDGAGLRHLRQRHAGRQRRRRPPNEARRPGPDR